MNFWMEVAAACASSRAAARSASLRFPVRFMSNLLLSGWSLLNSTGCLRPLDRDGFPAEGRAERSYERMFESYCLICPVPTVMELHEQMLAGLILQLIVVYDGQTGEVLHVHGRDGVCIVLEPVDLTICVV
jgi:hypothetical protein